ncbi:MAG: hypothetical protein PHE87_07080 [Victivallaceae bacterium]|nr:hypothetical protein [Victivallaceae bacterium]
MLTKSNFHHFRNRNKVSYHNNIVLLLMVLGLIVLSGCGVSKMLHPPIKEELYSSEATRALIGEWQLQDGDTIMPAIVTKNSKSTEEIEFLSIIIQKKDTDGIIRNYPPFMGVVQKIGDTLFLIVTSDLEQFTQTTGYLNDLWLVVPVFHAIELTPETSGYKLTVINFMENKGSESKPKWEPFNPKIKLEGDLVLNDTDSLIELIRTGQWKAGKTFILKPVKTPKK